MRDKINQQGLAPIYVRLTYKKVQASPFSTGIFVEPKKWIPKQQRVSGRSEKDQIVNEKIDLIKNEIDDVYLYLRKKKKDFNVHTVKSVYKYSELDILDVFEKYNKEASVGKAAGTVRNYYTHTRIFAEFLEISNEGSLSISDLTEAHGQRYIENLHTLNYQSVYVYKLFQHLKSVVEYAIKKHYIEEDPLKGLAIKVTRKKQLKYISVDDIEKLKKFEDVEPFNMVRDMFLFMCYTGLNHIDLLHLDPEKHIIWNEQDGRNWIEKIRKKEEKYQCEALIPLVDEAQAILDKYENFKHIRVPELAMFNRILKNLAFMAGIRRDLSTKMGRTTFAMMALNEWQLPMEVVSKMLGHNNLSTTQRYYVDIQKSLIQDKMKDIGKKK